ncbi:podoplanin [Homo sapiens]|nr:podoplanin, isoform CRA_a [Homo sapiens]KAI2515161.1 podoplanin [Homo sapiens]KAI4078720.1 podoplanin [Homo sapiens]
MLTPLGKFSTAKFAVRLPRVWEARAPSLSGAPAPTPPAPPPSRSSRLGLWPRCFLIFPQLRILLLGPQESNNSTGTMWKVSALLFVLGSASLWVLAEGASTGQPEDDTETTGLEGGVAMPGAEDDVVTPGTSEDRYKSGLTTLVATSVNSVTGIRIEDLPTSESTVHAQEQSPSATASNVATSHSTEKVDGDTQTTVEKDGLSTVTLVGIIVGVLLAIGFIGGIIVVVMRKMSGRP